MTARDAIEPDLMRAPLDGERLSQRWREMVDDPTLANIQGKVELDHWGRIIVMSPVSLEHGGTAGEIAHLLRSQLGGRTMMEVGVLTPAGVLAPDVAWCSLEFWTSRQGEIPLQVAPEICIEVASNSNTKEELAGKTRAYLQAGAREAWIVYPRAKRVVYHAASGEVQASSFQVDLSTLFD
jgi:Uma2 family endonuclease